MAKQLIIVGYPQGEPLSREQFHNLPGIKIYTENTNHSSGRTPVDKDSWLYRTYGNGKDPLFYPSMTLAVMRGLPDAYPITTQHWYDPKTGRTGENGRWEDSDLDEFNVVTKRDINYIKQACVERIIATIHSSEEVNLWLPQVFDTKISAISKERVPRIYDSLQGQIQELVNFVERINTILSKGLSDEETIKELHNIMPNIDNKDINQIQERQQAPSNILHEYVNHSGGALGADTFWGEALKEYSGSSRHYYHPGTAPGSPKFPPHADTPMPQEDIDEGRAAATEAARRMYGYSYNGLIKDELLIRDYAQVKYSEAVFAVGRIASAGEKFYPDRADDSRVCKVDTVTGGTGYAVNMAIAAGKPVYVFNQSPSERFPLGWYTWSNEKATYIPCETPVLTKNFAGIGSRNLTDEGKEAIRSCIEITAKAVSLQQNEEIKTQDMEQNTTTPFNEIKTPKGFKASLQEFNQEALITTAEGGYQAAIAGVYTNDAGDTVAVCRDVMSGKELRVSIADPGFSPMDEKAFTDALQAVIAKQASVAQSVEAVPERKPLPILSEKVYEEFTKKAQSGINPSRNISFSDEEKVRQAAAASQGVDAMAHPDMWQGPDGAQLHFGNPFSSNPSPVQAYMDWLTGARYLNVEPARRQWIIQAIFSGSLYGRDIFYSPSQNEDTATLNAQSNPTHAHVLLYFVNHPDRLLTMLNAVRTMRNSATGEKVSIETAQNWFSQLEAASMEKVLDYSLKTNLIRDGISASAIETVSASLENVKKTGLDGERLSEELKKCFVSLPEVIQKELYVQGNTINKFARQSHYWEAYNWLMGLDTLSKAKALAMFGAFREVGSKKPGSSGLKLESDQKLVDIAGREIVSTTSAKSLDGISVNTFNAPTVDNIANTAIGKLSEGGLSRMYAMLSGVFQSKGKAAVQEQPVADKQKTETRQQAQPALAQVEKPAQQAQVKPGKLYVSYYGSRSIPADAFKVQISNSAPTGYVIDHVFASLKPFYKDTVEPHKNGLIDDAEYVRRYTESTLSRNKDKILSELSNVMEKAGGKDVYLLCYEKPGDFCHRYLVNNFLIANGIECQENPADRAMYVTGRIALANEAAPAESVSAPVQEEGKRNVRNIWFTSKQNADLSNAAHYQIVFRGVEFTCVEQAFQYAKTFFSRADDAVLDEIRDKLLSTTNIGELRKLGKSVPELDVQAWDTESRSTMKDILRVSYDQETNKRHAEILLATGDDILTHDQAGDAWRYDFPNLLMEVRDELRAKIIDKKTNQPLPPVAVVLNEKNYPNEELQRQYRDAEKGNRITITPEEPNVVAQEEKAPLRSRQTPSSETAQAAAAVEPPMEKPKEAAAISQTEAKVLVAESWFAGMSFAEAEKVLQDMKWTKDSYLDGARSLLESVSSIENEPERKQVLTDQFKKLPVSAKSYIFEHAGGNEYREIAASLVSTVDGWRKDLSPASFVNEVSIASHGQLAEFYRSGAIIIEPAKGPYAPNVILGETAKERADNYRQWLISSDEPMAVHLRRMILDGKYAGAQVVVNSLQIPDDSYPGHVTYSYPDAPCPEQVFKHYADHPEELAKAINSSLPLWMANISDKELKEAILSRLDVIEDLEMKSPRSDEEILLNLAINKRRPIDVISGEGVASEWLASKANLAEILKTAAERTPVVSRSAQTTEEELNRSALEAGAVREWLSLKSGLSTILRNSAILFEKGKKPTLPNGETVAAATIPASDLNVILNATKDGGLSDEAARMFFMNLSDETKRFVMLTYPLSQQTNELLDARAEYNEQLEKTNELRPGEYITPEDRSLILDAFNRGDVDNEAARELFSMLTYPSQQYVMSAYPLSEEVRKAAVEKNASLWAAVRPDLFECIAAAERAGLLPEGKCEEIVAKVNLLESVNKETEFSLKGISEESKAVIATSAREAFDALSVEEKSSVIENISQRKDIANIVMQTLPEQTREAIMEGHPAINVELVSSLAQAAASNRRNPAAAVTTAYAGALREGAITFGVYGSEFESPFRRKITEGWTVEEVIEATRQWLCMEDYINVEPEHRDTWLKRLTEGKNVGMPVASTEAMKPYAQWLLETINNPKELLDRMLVNLVSKLPKDQSKNASRLFLNQDGPHFVTSSDRAKAKEWFQNLPEKSKRTVLTEYRFPSEYHSSEGQISDFELLNTILGEWSLRPDFVKEREFRDHLAGVKQQYLFSEYDKFVESLTPEQRAVLMYPKTEKSGDSIETKWQKLDSGDVQALINVIPCDSVETLQGHSKLTKHLKDMFSEKPDSAKILFEFSKAVKPILDARFKPFEDLSSKDMCALVSKAPFRSADDIPDTLSTTSSRKTTAPMRTILTDWSAGLRRPWSEYTGRERLNVVYRLAGERMTPDRLEAITGIRQNPLPSDYIPAAVRAEFEGKSAKEQAAMFNAWLTGANVDLNPDTLRSLQIGIISGTIFDDIPSEGNGFSMSEAGKMEFETPEAVMKYYIHHPEAMAKAINASESLWPIYKKDLNSVLTDAASKKLFKLEEGVVLDAAFFKALPGDVMAKIMEVYPVVTDKWLESRPVVKQVAKEMSLNALFDVLSDESAIAMRGTMAAQVKNNLSDLSKERLVKSLDESTLTVKRAVSEALDTLIGDTRSVNTSYMGGNMTAFLASYIPEKPIYKDPAFQQQAFIDLLTEMYGDHEQQLREYLDANRQYVKNRDTGEIFYFGEGEDYGTAEEAFLALKQAAKTAKRTVEREEARERAAAAENGLSGGMTDDADNGVRMSNDPAPAFTDATDANPEEEEREEKAGKLSKEDQELLNSTGINSAKMRRKRETAKAEYTQKTKEYDATIGKVYVDLFRTVCASDLSEARALAGDWLTKWDTLSMAEQIHLLTSFCSNESVRNESASMQMDSLRILATITSSSFNSMKEAEKQRFLSELFESLDTETKEVIIDSEAKNNRLSAEFNELTPIQKRTALLYSTTAAKNKLNKDDIGTVTRRLAPGWDINLSSAEISSYLSDTFNMLSMAGRKKVVYNKQSITVKAAPLAELHQRVVAVSTGVSSKKSPYEIYSSIPPQRMDQYGRPLPTYVFDLRDDYHSGKSSVSHDDMKAYCEKNRMIYSAHEKWLDGYTKKQYESVKDTLLKQITDAYATGGEVVILTDSDAVQFNDTTYTVMQDLERAGISTAHIFADKDGVVQTMTQEKAIEKILASPDFERVRIEHGETKDIIFNREWYTARNGKTLPRWIYAIPESVKVAPISDDTEYQEYVEPNYGIAPTVELHRYTEHEDLIASAAAESEIVLMFSNIRTGKKERAIEKEIKTNAEHMTILEKIWIPDDENKRNPNEESLAKDLLNSEDYARSLAEKFVKSDQVLRAVTAHLATGAEGPIPILILGPNAHEGQYRYATSKPSTEELAGALSKDELAAGGHKVVNYAESYGEQDIKTFVENVTHYVVKYLRQGFDEDRSLREEWGEDISRSASQSTDYSFHVLADGPGSVNVMIGNQLQKEAAVMGDTTLRPHIHVTDRWYMETIDPKDEEKTIVVEGAKAAILNQYHLGLKLQASEEERIRRFVSSELDFHHAVHLHSGNPVETLRVQVQDTLWQMGFSAKDAYTIAARVKEGGELSPELVNGLFRDVNRSGVLSYAMSAKWDAATIRSRFNAYAPHDAADPDGNTVSASAVAERVMETLKAAGMEEDAIRALRTTVAVYNYVPVGGRKEFSDEARNRFIDSIQSFEKEAGTPLYGGVFDDFVEKTKFNLSGSELAENQLAADRTILAVASSYAGLKGEKFERIMDGMKVFLRGEGATLRSATDAYDYISWMAGKNDIRFPEDITLGAIASAINAAKQYTLPEIAIPDNSVSPEVAMLLVTRYGNTDARKLISLIPEYAQSVRTKEHDPVKELREEEGLQQESFCISDAQTLSDFLNSEAVINAGFTPVIDGWTVENIDNELTAAGRIIMDNIDRTQIGFVLAGDKRYPSSLLEMEPYDISPEEKYRPVPICVDIDTYQGRNAVTRATSDTRFVAFSRFNDDSYKYPEVRKYIREHGGVVLNTRERERLQPLLGLPGAPASDITGALVNMFGIEGAKSLFEEFEAYTEETGRQITDGASLAEFFREKKDVLSPKVKDGLYNAIELDITQEQYTAYVKDGFVKFSPAMTEMFSDRFPQDGFDMLTTALAAFADSKGTGEVTTETLISFIEEGMPGIPNEDLVNRYKRVFGISHPVKMDGVAEEVGKEMTREEIRDIITDAANDYSPAVALQNLIDDEHNRLEKIAKENRLAKELLDEINHPVEIQKRQQDAPEMLCYKGDISILNSVDQMGIVSIHGELRTSLNEGNNPLAVSAARNLVDAMVAIDRVTVAASLNCACGRVALEEAVERGFKVVAVTADRLDSPKDADLIDRIVRSGGVVLSEANALGGLDKDVLLARSSHLLARIGASNVILESLRPDSPRLLASPRSYMAPETVVSRYDGTVNVLAYGEHRATEIARAFLDVKDGEAVDYAELRAALQSNGVWTETMEEAYRDGTLSKVIHNMVDSLSQTGTEFSNATALLRKEGVNALTVSGEGVADMMADLKQRAPEEYIGLRYKKVRKQEAYVKTEAERPSLYQFSVVRHGDMQVFVVPETVPGVREAVRDIYGEEVLFANGISEAKAMVQSGFDMEVRERKGGAWIADDEPQKVDLIYTSMGGTYGQVFSIDNAPATLMSKGYSPEAEAQAIRDFEAIKTAVEKDLKTLYEIAGYDGSKQIAAPGACYALVSPRMIMFMQGNTPVASISLNEKNRLVVRNINTVIYGTNSYWTDEESLLVAPYGTKPFNVEVNCANIQKFLLSAESEMYIRSTAPGTEQAVAEINTLKRKLATANEASARINAQITDIESGKPASSEASADELSTKLQEIDADRKRIQQRISDLEQSLSVKAPGVSLVPRSVSQTQAYILADKGTQERMLEDEKNGNTIQRHGNVEQFIREVEEGIESGNIHTRDSIAMSGAENAVSLHSAIDTLNAAINKKEKDIANRKEAMGQDGSADDKSRAVIEKEEKELGELKGALAKIDQRDVTFAIFKKSLIRLDTKLESVKGELSQSKANLEALHSQIQPVSVDEESELDATAQAEIEAKIAAEETNISKKEKEIAQLQVRHDQINATLRNIALSKDIVAVGQEKATSINREAFENAYDIRRSAISKLSSVGGRVRDDIADISRLISDAENALSVSEQNIELNKEKGDGEEKLPVLDDEKKALLDRQIEVLSVASDILEEASSIIVGAKNSVAAVEVPRKSMDTEAISRLHGALLESKTVLGTSLSSKDGKALTKEETDVILKTCSDYFAARDEFVAISESCAQARSRAFILEEKIKNTTSKAELTKLQQELSSVEKNVASLDQIYEEARSERDMSLVSFKEAMLGEDNSVSALIESARTILKTLSVADKSLTKQTERIGSAERSGIDSYMELLSKRSSDLSIVKDSAVMLDVVLINERAVTVPDLALSAEDILAAVKDVDALMLEITDNTNAIRKTAHSVEKAYRSADGVQKTVEKDGYTILLDSARRGNGDIYVAIHGEKRVYWKAGENGKIEDGRPLGDGEYVSAQKFGMFGGKITDELGKTNIVDRNGKLVLPHGVDEVVAERKQDLFGMEQGYPFIVVKNDGLYNLLDYTNKRFLNKEWSTKPDSVVYDEDNKEFKVMDGVNEGKVVMTIPLTEMNKKKEQSAKESKGREKTSQGKPFTPGR